MGAMLGILFLGIIQGILIAEEAPAFHHLPLLIHAHDMRAAHVHCLRFALTL